jgi:hypothetical protein
MATVKPNIRRYSSTVGLPRRQQVVVSKLRMGYTNITHEHKLSDDPKPYCNECKQDLIVWHLLWQCRNFNTQLKEKYERLQKIYTDGSKNDKRAGYAIMDRHLKQITLLWYQDTWAYPETNKQMRKQRQRWMMTYNKTKDLEKWLKTETKKTRKE